MESHASISNDVLSRYAADAALEVPGVRRLLRRGVKLEHADDEHVKVVLRLAVEWGASIPDVGRAVQRRVREYLARMADVQAAEVDVVVDEIGPP